MKSYKMSWRNLWRNKRRTLITVGSVFFAVFFALIMRSLQLGTYDHMFRNVIESYTGYLQIQHEDFWDNKIIDNAFSYTPALEETVLSDKNVSAAVPRFESFALASSGALTKGVLVMGIDPEKETLLSNVKGKLVKFKLNEENIESLKKSDIPEKYRENLDLYKGKSFVSSSSMMIEMGISVKDSASIMPVLRELSYFKNGYFKMGENSALIGDKMAAFLKVGLGDTLVLIGQGYHGTTAAGKFRIAGIVKIPAPDLDNKIVYLPVDISREFYNAPGMLTSLVLSIRKNDDSEIIRMIAALGPKIEPPLRVLGWREMNELMINQMDADSKSGMIMILILYMVIAFGIFGTVLMMTAERRREFGVLVAVGMQKTKLATVVAIEMFYIGLLGIASGIAAALPVIFYGYSHPIRFTGEMASMYEDYGMEPVMPFLPVDWYFLWQSAVVAIIVLIAVIYPVRKISKIQIVNSLKA
ncbi:MAG: FtsX-like permease family protein [Bacteroidia bacterium]|nr:FtsX-like permease family protein [Bacteroidia bacterium]